MSLSSSPSKVSDDARRLTSSIIGGDNSSGNLAHEAVSAVETHLLQRGWPVGETLGTYSDIRKSLGLGRPACREAMLILETCGLLNIRRGPGGGLFVAAPSAQDAIEATLIYLTISGASKDCIPEFRLLTWRMIVEAAIDSHVDAATTDINVGEWGFAVDLARRMGKPTMAWVAEFAEMLVRTCEGLPAPAHDLFLDRALMAGDTRQAFARLEDLAAPRDLAAPLLALEARDRNSAWSASARRSAMGLAVKMMREMIYRPEKLEAEWETAERLGYSAMMVRQARRILQNFGVVRCQRGRKGALWGLPASPAGVIRLLASWLTADGMTFRDNAEVANFLTSSVLHLLAERATESAQSPTMVSNAVADRAELTDLIQSENLLVELAGNPLLLIMTRTLGLANPPSGETGMSPQSCADIIALNRRILRAVEAGDAETTRLLGRAKEELIRQSEPSYRSLV